MGVFAVSTVVRLSRTLRGELRGRASAGRGRRPVSHTARIDADGRLSAPAAAEPQAHRTALPLEHEPRNHMHLDPPFVLLTRRELARVAST